MASADGGASDHLSYLAAAEPAARRYGFFALLRGLEARARGLPRIGLSRIPANNIIDLAHEPTLEFPAPTVQSIEAAPGGRKRVRSLFLGLTGPMGALPIHMTEYAMYERRLASARPFGRFLDLITDRMLQFFYRAWADSQPAAQADRPGDDRFARHVEALSGGWEVRADDALGTDFNPTFYAGSLVSRRSAAAVQDALSRLIGRPVQLEEFVVRWRGIEPAQQTRLGGDGAYGQLGVSSVLGASVCVAEDTFRVRLSTHDIDDYLQFLPGKPRHRAIVAALKVLAPPHLDWELQLELSETQAPGAALDGASPLGLASWLSPRGRAVVRADARIRN